MDSRQPDLCKYRMEKAEQCLKSARLLLESGDYAGALNRSYYAVFNSVRSILALEGTDFSKHSGVISHFQKNYVKTGVFDKEYSRILTESFSVRNDSDYDDYCIVSKEQAETQIKNAQFFVDGVKEYVKNSLLNT